VLGAYVGIFAIVSVAIGQLVIQRAWTGQTGGSTGAGATGGDGACRSHAIVRQITSEELAGE
jgi:hypothetical protein